MRFSRQDRFFKDRTRVNDHIRVPRVRVIDPDGEQLGILPTAEALQLARERYGLDLVEVSPNATPPVCKILDYGKHKYQEKKKAQEAKKHHMTVQVKEVKFRPKTDVHDFNFKVKHVRRFLQEGNKAKVTIFFRGREMAYTNRGVEVLQKVSSLVEDIGQTEQEPTMEGRFMSMVIAPKSARGQQKHAQDENK